MFFRLILIVSWVMISSTSQAAENSDEQGILIDAHDSYYKVPFPGPGGLESWYIPLELFVDSGHTAPAIESVLMSGERAVGTRMLAASSVEALWIPPADDADQMRLPLIFHEPAALEIDSIRFTALVDDAPAGPAVTVRLETYTPRNEYRFPLSGNAILTAGYFNSGGHLSTTTLFAVDAIGLDGNYAPMADPDGTDNAAMSGWGREIVAPADGTVVFVENGIPDQTLWSYDRDSFRREDGSFAVWGNSVVIDHGQGEFGILMHMMEGSISVNVGDIVEQGDFIGRLGNSGDSYGPHLHFHLQDSSEPNDGRGLPLSFSDIDLRFLRKGEYITPAVE